MMKNKIPCEVVRDLLPSFVDHLTSEVTNEVVEEHLENCTECKKIFQRMKEPELETEEHFEEEREIDFLKKTKKRIKKRIVFSILTVCFILAVGIMMKRYVVGTGNGNPFGNNLVIDEIKVDGKKIILSGSTLDENLVIRAVSFSEEKGTVMISFRGVEKGIYTSDRFSEEYHAKKEIKQVKIGDKILWAGGKKISPFVSELFQAKNPYVGDMSKNMKLASILDMEKVLGEFTSELETKEEPYKWHIYGKKKMDSQAKWESCKAYAYILLATVDNLSEISFSFQGEEVRAYSKEDATEYAGEDIKKAGNDINKLQNLIEYTGIASIIVPADQILADSEKMQLNISVDTEQKISRLNWYLYVNDKMQTIGGLTYHKAKIDRKEVQNNEAEIKSGETLSLAFRKTDFDKVLRLDDKVEVKFGILDKEEKEVFTKRIEIEPDFQRAYQLNLSGSEKKGYVISLQRLEKRENFSAGVYKYETKEMMEAFSILLAEDGSFTYSESLISSYIGWGKYTVDGDLLTLKEEEGAVQYFKIGAKSLSFIEKGSDNFRYIPLKDGTVFQYTHEPDVDSYHFPSVDTFKEVPGEIENYARRIGVKEEICSLMGLKEGTTDSWVIEDGFTFYKYSVMRDELVSAENPVYGFPVTDNEKIMAIYCVTKKEENSNADADTMDENFTTMVNTELCDFLNETDYVHENYLFYSLDLTPKEVTAGVAGKFPELFIVEGMDGKKYYRNPEQKENLTEEERTFLKMEPLEKMQRFHR